MRDGPYGSEHNARRCTCSSRYDPPLADPLLSRARPWTNVRYHTDQLTMLDYGLFSLWQSGRVL
jgi:hypothetical protein